MDKYNLLASWIGWPAVTALILIIGGFGTFFFKKQIDILKDTNVFLEKQINDLKNYTPDAVAKRLFERSKLLEHEFESLAQDNEKDKKRKIELENELIETRQEAQNLRSQIDSVQKILEDIDIPREGKFKAQIAREILRNADTQKCIYIPLWLMGKLELDSILALNDRRPYKYEVIFPGMHQMYVLFFDNKNEDIGYVHSPYIEIYNRDYFITLLELFKFIPIEIGENVSGEGGEGSSYLIPSAEFHCISPIDPNIIYIKINMTENEISTIKENLDLR